MNFRDRALCCTLRGLSVIPLLPESKVAIKEGWQSLATADTKVITEWNAENPDYNCGIVYKAVPDGFWALETDSAELVDKYEAETGNNIPQTLTIQSSPGRGHRLYKHTAASIAMGNIKQEDATGFSVRCNNQYTVSPFSIHPKTKHLYQIVNDVPIVPAPDDFVAWLTAQRKTKLPPTAALTGPPIPYGSHDTELTRIAGKLRYDGMEEGVMSEALIEICEKRCENYGDDYEDMCRKIAASICKHPIGKDERAFVGSQNYSNLLTTLDTPGPSWIMQNVQKPRELSSKPLTWIVDEMILEHGLHLFSGKQGSMKTMLAMMLAKVIACGESFMGRNVRGVPVVYVDKENPEAEVNRRAVALGLRDLDNVRLWGDWNPDNPPPLTFDDPRLIECARREGAFFIFDSLSSFLDGADENDTGAMMQIMGKARLLARSCAGVSILHHQAKNGSPGSRGNTAIPASTDMAFIVQKENNTVTVSEERFRMCRGYTMSFEMDFGGSSGIYTYRCINNGMIGSEAIKPVRLSDKEKERLETARADIELIERARVRIEEAYANGHTLNQSQLATLIGITSARTKGRILNGSPDKPWSCVPSGEKGGSLVFLPKEKTPAN